MPFVLYEEVRDDYYIKIESEFDSNIQLGNLISINIIEGFNFSTPFFVLNLLDGAGDLFSNTYINPDQIYDVYLGDTPNNAIRHKFSLASLKTENAGLGRPDNFILSATFINHQWLGFVGTTHSRSWHEKKYSFVVENIAEEFGFDKDVEATKESYNIIQPYWTNYQLIKWMKKQCISNEGHNGYEFGITMDNKIIFRSIHSLFNRDSVKEMHFGDNSKDGFSIFPNIRINQQYSDMIFQGAGGMTDMWYDYNNREWVTKTSTISDSSQNQLSDWFFISEDHQTSERIFYGGRNPQTEIAGDNRVSMIGNSMLSSQITIDGDMTLHIGDIVNILIPASQLSKRSINNTYSGEWMISKVNHQIDTNKRNLKTHLTLARPGFNGINYGGFVKTNSGKKS